MNYGRFGAFSFQKKQKMSSRSSSREMSCKLVVCFSCFRFVVFLLLLVFVCFSVCCLYCVFTPLHPCLRLCLALWLACMGARDVACLYAVAPNAFPALPISLSLPPPLFASSALYVPLLALFCLQAHTHRQPRHTPGHYTPHLDTQTGALAWPRTFGGVILNMGQASSPLLPLPPPLSLSLSSFTDSAPPPTHPNSIHSHYFENLPLFNHGFPPDRRQ